MNVITKIHSNLVFSRRSIILSKLIAQLIPNNAKVLDVGCGDGLIDYYITNLRPDINITGVDILKREKTHIPVTLYDGNKLPFSDNFFNCIVFIDVLHHTNEPEILLAEAKRVSRKTIIIKDHYCNNLFAYYRLKFMDWVGNKFYGVNLPYNYYSKIRWHNLYKKLYLNIDKEVNKLDLYPIAFNFVFERDLQFITKLSFK